VKASAGQRRDEPVPDRSTVALWHEVGRRTRDDTTATVYRTTPITVGRPERGAVEAAVSCRVCRRPVRVRVVDAATARRRRRWGTLLVRSQFVLALVLVCAEVTGLAAFDVRLGSGFPGLLAGLALVLPVLLSALGLAEWAERRAGGVTILRPGDGRHLLGSGGSEVVLSRGHAPS
jgi:hypothetical protein